MLLFVFFYAADRVDDAFDRAKNGREEGAFSIEDLGHIESKRLHADRHSDHVDGNLNPTIGCHDRQSLEPLGADERV